MPNLAPKPVCRGAGTRISRLFLVTKLIVDTRSITRSDGVGTLLLMLPISTIRFLYFSYWDLAYGLTFKRKEEILKLVVIPPSRVKDDILNLNLILICGVRSYPS